MDEIVKLVLANLAVIGAVALFFKHRLEHYIDKKIGLGISKKLENHKHELQKEMEECKSSLQSKQTIKSGAIDKNMALIEHLSEIRSATQYLIRVHQEGNNQNISSAWERYFSNIPAFEDFMARNSSPYFDKYETQVKELAELMNQITRSLEEAKNSGQSRYSCDWSGVISATDTLKKLVYQDILQQ